MELTGRPNRRIWHGDFETFPAGYRFKPSDEELITTYLIPTIDGTQVPPNIITHIKLYKHNPYQLQETMNRIPSNMCDAWYFFTPIMRKYKNGDRPNRTVPGGYWKATGKEKSIKDGNNTVIGAKRSLVFYKGEHPNGVKTDYIMHEFREANRPRRPRSDDADDMLLDECVLSRIYKKSADEEQNEDNQRAAENTGEMEGGNNRNAEGNSGGREEGLETEENNRDAVGEINYLASNLPYPYPTDPTAEVATEVNNSAWNVSVVLEPDYNSSEWLNEIEPMLQESYGNGITTDQGSQNPTVDSNVALQDSSAGITRHQDLLARYLGMDSNWYQRMTPQDSTSHHLSHDLSQYPLPFATAVPPHHPHHQFQYTTIDSHYQTVIAEHQNSLDMTVIAEHQNSLDMAAPSHQHSQYQTVNSAAEHTSILNIRQWIPDEFETGPT